MISEEVHLDQKNPHNFQSTATMDRDDDIWSSKEGLLDDFDTAENESQCSTCESRRKFRLHTVVSGLVSLTIFLLLLSLSIGLTSQESKNCFPFWSETEICRFGYCSLIVNSIHCNLHPIVALKKELPATTKRVQFAAGLRYTDQKELYRAVSSEQHQYVGEPTKEMVDAWIDFIGGESASGNHSKNGT